MEDGGFDAIGRPLGQLFRLGASRKVHARQVTAAGFELSPPGAALLARIVEDGPITLGDLSAATDMDPGAASRQVKALEADGLVEREGREGDARIRVLRATAAGRRVRQRIAEVQDRHMADVLDGWSAADRATFARLLDRFVEDLRSVQYRPTDRPFPRPQEIGVMPRDAKRSGAGTR
jgi:DNA-binding MarR family transcriptional regulator